MGKLFGNRNTSLTATITRYYMSFFLLVPLLVMISSSMAQAISVAFMGSAEGMDLVAAAIVRSDYQNIDSIAVQRAGGWVEILRDNKVVYVLGNKQDQKQEYTDEELRTLTSRYGKRLVTSFADEEFYYSTAMFVGDDKNEYMCVVKIPVGNLESNLSSVFNVINPEMRAIRTMILSVLLMVFIFCVLFLFSIKAYGRITALKITGPLEAIRDGLASVTAGNLNTRMDFEAEREFAQIRDAFNYMTGRLQSTEHDKHEMEENRKRMIMGISHDLKTPITTIYGYAKALSDGMVEDPEKQQKHLLYIRDKAMAMSRMIDDLFQYSSMEGSEYKLNRKQEDFAEFLRELVAENYIEVENRGFALECDIPEEAVTACFDRDELWRALSNIIANVLKYNPAGTTLIVTLSTEPGLLRLHIGDNGVGIADHLKPAIFEEFVRGDAARPSDGGSGLGLAIARRIIGMHGGAISLSSEQGKGSMFVITLPRE